MVPSTVRKGMPGPWLHGHLPHRPPRLVVLGRARYGRGAARLAREAGTSSEADLVGARVSHPCNPAIFDTTSKMLKRIQNIASLDRPAPLSDMARICCPMSLNARLRASVTNECRAEYGRWTQGSIIDFPTVATLLTAKHQYKSLGPGAMGVGDNGSTPLGMPSHRTFRTT